MKSSVKQFHTTTSTSVIADGGTKKVKVTSKTTHLCIISYLAICSLPCCQRTSSAPHATCHVSPQRPKHDVDASDHIPPHYYIYNPGPLSEEGCFYVAKIRILFTRRLKRAQTPQKNTGFRFRWDHARKRMREYQHKYNATGN